MSVAALCVKCLYSFDGVFVSCPCASCNTADNVPAHGLLDYAVHSFAAVENKSESSVARLAGSDSAAVVKSDEAHAARAVSGEAVNGHFCHNVAAVFDV